MAYLRIEPATNGFIASYDDPDIVKANHESDEDWNDPEVNTIFPTEQDLMGAMPGILDKVVQGEVERAKERANDFQGGFDAMTKEG